MSGLEHKYNVRRANDPKGKHDKCRFFVLDPQHDETAGWALLEYAERTSNKELADDLREWLNGIEY